jgi:hypothetical protein
MQVYAGDDSGLAGCDSYSTEERMKKGFTEVGLGKLMRIIDIHCEDEMAFAV